MDTDTKRQITSSEPDQVSKDAYDNKFDYTKAIVYTNKLIDEHETTVDRDVIEARAARNLEVDSNQLQARGNLDSDEVLIPMRVVDSNISREQPAYVSFLTQSRRLAIFQCLDDPSKDSGRIEKAFTTGMRYEGWLIPHFKVLDGAQAYGLDFLEVEYNEKKPLNVALSHVGRDNLIYNHEAENFQSCDEVIRRYDLTVFQLQEFVAKFNFDKTVVDNMVKENETDLNKSVKVYKRLFKFEGKVYVSWLVKGCNADKWLKAPELLWRGKKIKNTTTVIVIDPVTQMPTPTQQETMEKSPETQYPFHPFIYRLTEEKSLSSSKGRVYLDSPEQDVQTCLWSCAVNQAERSSRIFGSPDIPDGNGSALEQTNFKATPGIYKTKMGWWSMPPPSPELIKTAQQLSLQKQNESGKINFAVNNRVDSRKTAEEIKVANEQQALLSGVQVALYAMFLQSVYTDVWSLVQSMALAGDIVFLPVKAPLGAVSPGLGSMMPGSGMMMQQGMMQSQPTNDIESLSLSYKVVPAGESDVIEKAEELTALKEIFPVAQQVSPELANKMFQDMIEIMFPEKAIIYNTILARAGDISTLITGMFKTLEAVMIDPATNNLKPEYAAFAPQIEQLKQRAMPYMPQEMLQNANNASNNQT